MTTGQSTALETKPPQGQLRSSMLLVGAVQQAAPAMDLQCSETLFQRDRDSGSCEPRRTWETIQLVNKEEVTRRHKMVLAVALVLALATGFLASWPLGDAPVADAYQGVNFVCPLGDMTKTSSLSVSHHTSPSYLGTSTVVEPDDSETWAITAIWESAVAPLTTNSTVSYTTATWNGSQWALSSTTLGGGVAAIGICQGDTCEGSGNATHSWSYKLIVDVTDPYLGLNLDKVTYVTTSIDDGYTIEDPTQTEGYCYLDASVSPTSQAQGATDEPPTWDSNRCPYTCFTGGASVTIYYD